MHRIDEAALTEAIVALASVIHDPAEHNLDWTMRASKRIAWT